ncbi:hypothetical protein AB4865_05840 [Capnocytophaga sp. ARDL2]|uniref:hypothetical protein n=1 Tax=Capnocytophaga sp. ARDL2 TaxID=3238809 RepID=UPI003556EFBF
MLVVNFLGNDFVNNRVEQGLIYGNISLVYIGNNRIMALPNTYNFEIHHGKIFTMRNFLTFMGGMFNGHGTAYPIYFNGTTKINTR